MAKTNDEQVDDLEIDEDKPMPSGRSGNELVLSASKVELIRRLLANIKDNGEKLTQLLGSLSAEEEARISIGQLGDAGFEQRGQAEVAGGQVIEGVFDGEHMIGPDGKQYSVPANYASKSKLVEGDILKLTITGNGTFVYKQIGPIERLRVVGTLERVPTGFVVSVEDRKWRVLTASVTYFKGQGGDEAVILVPKAGESKWAAVENIVKKTL